MVRAEDFDSSIVGSNPATPASRKPSERAAFVLAGVAICFDQAPHGALVRLRRSKIGKLACQAQSERIFALWRISGLTDRRGRRSLQKRSSQSAASYAHRRCAFFLSLAGVALDFDQAPHGALVRFRRSKIGKLACQAQSERIFAIGEYPA